MKTKYLFLLLVFSVSCLSCNDWLDIKPKGETSKEDMFSDTQGYNRALAGVYYTLTTKSLYGRSLAYGEIDLMAQYWNIRNNINHMYYPLSTYNYKNIRSESLVNSIWSKFYESITNANVIIENIRKAQSNIDTPELIEGEALGLRAFAHFELYRLFGPVVRSKSDLQKESIPYRDKYDVAVKQPETCENLLLSVKKDLLEALRLFEDDPIRIHGRSYDGNDSDIGYNNILNRRGVRMNYFAVMGLLARVEQCLQSPDEAYKYAKNVINDSDVLSFVDIRSLESGQGDYSFSTEYMFSMNISNLYDETKMVFGYEGVSSDEQGSLGGGSSLSNDSYLITSDDYTDIVNNIYVRKPEGQATDIRLRYWFAQAGRDKNYYITKLAPPEGTSVANSTYEPVVPIITLSEMYFIACEAQIGKDNELALSYLNTVREARGLNQLIGPYSDEELLDFLIREARKEFLGSGQMFYMYKRLFAPIYIADKVIIDPITENFELPIPSKEKEFS